MGFFFQLPFDIIYKSITCISYILTWEENFMLELMAFSTLS